ncbi:lytic transglycosylase [Pontibacter sp. SGAir0037]|nr:lytic transglycosylase [Pontibacter sp. SGAir0037]
MGMGYAQSSGSFSFKHEKPIAEDTFASDTTLLSPEELALLVEYIPNVPNDVIQDRLNCIEADIPLVFNPFVRSHIDYFTIRNRKYTRTMLTRENVYFPLFEKYLKKYNMPQDMKYLSIVESGLNPKAASWAGAVGLWQFIKTTGKEYGLDQNQYIDERMDPEKATDAACRFLSRLYKTYGDWELAMAAYNCGPGNVNKAIKRAGGGQKGFWDIFPYLPKETRSYVPSMTAVIYSMKYAPEHNIFSDSILYAQDVETLKVSHALDLEKLAEELHMAPEVILALNPEIKQKMLPDHTRNYALRIPAHRSALLASSTDLSCILAAAKPTPPPVIQDIPAKAPVMLASANTSNNDTITAKSPAPKKAEEKTYLVQKGDNLIQIARSHNVTVEELKEWNNLNGAYITVNQKLTIHQSAAAQPEENTLLASAEAKAEPVAKTTAKAAPKQAPVAKVKEMIHHVQPGDTLWNISQRYDGISVEQIKKLNKLKSDNLKPGQKLILS